MTLYLENFGPFKKKTMPVASLTLQNGAGKTTLINAYIFALTGKTINGYVPRRIDAQPDEVTSVTLGGFPGAPGIRRAITKKGTTLYVDGDACSQTDFRAAMRDKGVDVEFAALCANVNVLTEGISSDELRRLLVQTEVLDNDEVMRLRKEVKRLTSEINTADRYATTVVAVPIRTVEPLTGAEREYLDRYKESLRIFNAGVTTQCATCGHKFSDAEIGRNKTKLQAVDEHIRTAFDEATRIKEKAEAYVRETQDIDDANRLMQQGITARTNAIELRRQRETLERQLQEYDTSSCNEALPEGVTVVTEKKLNTGNVQSVCQLSYNGVPLVSVNRAERVRILIAILDRARIKKGMCEVPIIVDNAEVLDVAPGIENIILLKVLHNGTFPA